MGKAPVVFVTFVCIDTKMHALFGISGPNSLLHLVYKVSALVLRAERALKRLRAKD